MAKLCQVSQADVSRIERGLVEPTKDFLRRFTERVGCVVALPAGLVDVEDGLVAVLESVDLRM